MPLRLIRTLLLACLLLPALAQAASHRLLRERW